MPLLMNIIQFRRLLLVLIITATVLSPGCNIIGSETTQVETVQMVVSMQADDYSPVSGYGSGHVYMADVEQSNRLVPDRLRLDWTWFVNNSEGQLPHGLVGPGEQFPVEAFITSGGTYQVRRAFTSF